MTSSVLLGMISSKPYRTSLSAESRREARVDSEYLVCEEGEQGGVSVPRAQQDDSPAFASSREGVNG